MKAVVVYEIGGAEQLVYTGLDKEAISVGVRGACNHGKDGG